MPNSLKDIDECDNLKSPSRARGSKDQRAACTGSSGTVPLDRLCGVMEAFESGALDLPDFSFTGDDYRYRFDPETKQRFLDLLRERFNSGIRYKGHALKRDTVIEQKTIELSRYVVGRTGRLGFSEPSPNLHREDDQELRRRILGISQSEARRLGIGKSTLHYLRKRTARASLRIYGSARKAGKGDISEKNGG